MATILASAPVLRRDQFSYHAATESFSAFASDLGHFTGRLFADSCDEGFGIRSNITDKVIYFSHSETEKNGDGDVVSQTFVAVVDIQSVLAGLKVVVFNT